QLRPDAVDELVADDFVSHTWPSDGDSKSALRRATESMAAALRDPRFEIEELIAEEDLVVVRVTASATATGEFMGADATGRSYQIGEIHIFRVRDGQVVEHWHQYDAPGMMRQLGISS
ncbi:MAG TPA: ester cyclase, partial [Candidatus Limnocylindrales bacterium]|nr:ester cyclase [Candidatus Limnocylindrales bacterium]